MTYIAVPATGIVLGGSVNSTHWNDQMTLMMTLVVNRTGYWGASFFVNSQNDEALTTSMTSYIYIRYAGVQRATGRFGSLGGGFSGGGGAYCAPVLIANGQAIQVYMNKDYGDQFNVMGPGYPERMNLIAFFVPTSDYPS